MAQQHLERIGLTFIVDELRSQLAANPQLWNEIPVRTAMYKNSPHREIDDIWVRYNPFKNFQGNLQKFNEEHTAEWYPCVEKIPEARVLAEELAYALYAGSAIIGAVLLTRVPPGKQVYPHVDVGWHARVYDKYIIQIASTPGQSFNFEGESLDCAPGECYWFDNSAPHWVLNPTSEERISLIVCLRREKCL